MAIENAVVAKALVMSELKRKGTIGFVETVRHTVMDAFTLKAGTNGTESVGTLHTEYMIDGATYVVTIGEVECEITGRIVSDFLTLGNKAIQDPNYTNTGEVFFIELDLTGDKDWCLLLLREAVTENTIIKVEMVAETIHPIDPKFLPGVCLPVVELSTTFAIGASFTEEENAKLKAVWESGTPMITKCNMTLENFGNLTDCQAVWNRGLSSAVCAFLFSFGGLMLQIASMDNGETWLCNIQ